MSRRERQRGEFWRGRKVLVTGHTGFKGSWLCEWLLQLGADVHGASLGAAIEGPTPALADVLRIRQRVHHHELDLVDAAATAAVVDEVRPDVVLHLAAQALVRASYEQPLATLASNVMGTAHLFAALGAVGYTVERPCAVVCVTSDKCYRNDGSGRAFAETSPFGGSDPYSASKGMVELLATAWRSSFFAPAGRVATVRLATARAGNVVGGGDTARDRIVVDAVQALAAGDPIRVRQPQAVRPWQHVLDPLGGYLDLAQRLYTVPGASESGWNFGPGTGGECTVAQLCEALVQAWGSGSWRHVATDDQKPEAAVLRLVTHKAKRELGWRPTWSFAQTIARTVDWYRAAHACGHEPERMLALTQAQIAAFVRDRAGAAPRAPSRQGELAPTTGGPA
jgi:CDP-glucose 4,6-dehydratase